jgi:hypothetical protein
MAKQLSMFENEPEPNRAAEKRTRDRETVSISEPIKAKCPVCNFTCLESKLRPGNFFCGYCSDIKGEKVYFTVEVPF